MGRSALRFCRVAGRCDCRRSRHHRLCTPTLGRIQNPKKGGVPRVAQNLDRENPKIQPASDRQNPLTARRQLSLCDTLQLLRCAATAPATSCPTWPTIVHSFPRKLSGWAKCGRALPDRYKAHQKSCGIWLTALLQSRQRPKMAMT